MRPATNDPTKVTNLILKDNNKTNSRNSAAPPVLIDLNIAAPAS